MSEPRIEDREPLPYIGIWSEVTNGVRAMADKTFPELFAWLGEHGVAPTGPPFLRTYEVDADGSPLVLEAGAPVVPGAESAAEGPVRGDSLPGGRYLAATHVGPYRSEAETDLGEARDRLMRWADENGVSYGRPSERGTELPCVVERFLRGPVETSDHSTWETEIAFLVVE